MANFLATNAFRIAVTTLNFLSPSIIADVILHPFDFANVLIQIGYNPDGTKYEAATFLSVLVQYALFTFYIPYLLTSMHGLHFMGMPSPSIFYYVSYIYKKEGIIGCYRGLMPKVLERLIMHGVNDKVKKQIDKDTSTTTRDSDNDKFVRTIINSVCAQFFAVLASHPFHVLMVSCFAEFAINKKSSMVELSHSIYKDDGYFGFFTGLTARLLGEILSLIFSITYTTIINRQLRRQQAILEPVEVPNSEGGANQVVNYVTDASRFTAFKEPKENRGAEAIAEEVAGNPTRISQYRKILYNLLASFTHNSSRGYELRNSRRTNSFWDKIPLTSKLFYYIMLRDFLSKKISNPFFLVCHCAIVLDTGWDKFPFITYSDSLFRFVRVKLIPARRNRLHKLKHF